jgi:hypothetical protein
MEARRVVVVDVGLAEALRGSTVSRFLSASFERWNRIHYPRFFIGCEPTRADSVTTSSHTTNEFSVRGFLIESSNPAQRQHGGRKRLGRQRGQPRYRESCARS